MNLKTARIIVLILCGLGIIVALLFPPTIENGHSMYGVQTGIFLILLAVVVGIFGIRCPHCGRSVFHKGGGDFCPHCGKRLDEKDDGSGGEKRD
ncbi:MAG: hypothetical protein IJR00_11440 [Lachnospiraceae bacterium]|nr:hypothetical protein [Lachnospiraceae bacterium]